MSNYHRTVSGSFMHVSELSDMHLQNIMRQRDRYGYHGNSRKYTDEIRRRSRRFSNNIVPSDVYSDMTGRSSRGYNCNTGKSYYKRDYVKWLENKTY